MGPFSHASACGLRQPQNLVRNDIARINVTAVSRKSGKGGNGRFSEGKPHKISPFYSFYEDSKNVTWPRPVVSVRALAGSPMTRCAILRPAYEGLTRWEKVNGLYRTRVAARMLCEGLIGGMVERELRAVSRPPNDPVGASAARPLNQMPRSFADFQTGRPAAAHCSNERTLSSPRIANPWRTPMA